LISHAILGWNLFTTTYVPKEIFDLLQVIEFIKFLDVLGIKGIIEFFDFLEFFKGSEFTESGQVSLVLQIVQPIVVILPSQLVLQQIVYQ
jgi:hypothetical protein